MTSPACQDTPSSLGRALLLLDVFAREQGELSIRELAARAGVSRSTTHRLAQELVEWGGLERTPTGLRLGVKLFELGTLAPNHTSIREAAAPFLHRLHGATQLTANLAVRHGHEILYLEKISSRHCAVPHTRLGGRGTLHATALGKAIMAHSPQINLESLQPHLQRFTEHTHTTIPGLRRELAQVRMERVAYDVEESCLGLFCVASPILDRDGRAIAALSVTGATALQEARRFAPTVVSAAVRMSRVLTSVLSD